jgi:UDP-glucose 4-epimerase
MRILITGGAGFIGSHIVETLIKHGHTPAVVDNLSSGNPKNIPEGIPLFEIDICDSQKLEEAFQDFKPELVCHQAAQMSVSRSVREPAFDAQVNIMGLINVLDQSVQNNVKKVVFASSGGVLYGDVFEPAKEDHPANPISPYGISKWAGEKYLEFYSKEHQLKTVALRYANVYGPRQNPHGEAGVVAIFCRNLLQSLPITVNGDGKYIRDYVHGSDVAEANRLALEADLPESFNTFNIGMGTPTDVNQLAEQVYQLCQVKIRENGSDEILPHPDHGPARAGDLRSNLVDASKAKSILGWKPRFELESGLAETVDWFATNAIQR